MVSKIPAALKKFIAVESSGGIALVAACALALFFANSPVKQGYANFFTPLAPFISEGLMSIFFFLVGLEIKREFVDGELRNPKSAALPIISAIGGMATPALIFHFFTTGTAANNGWAIAMPTDIALSIGALALLGSRVNPSLKIFLLTLAIADDLGSILVLGTFYSGGISPLRIASTIGAVLLAWVVPSTHSLPTQRLIDLIHPWSSFLVIPLFALANIGIRIDFSSLGAQMSSPVTLGIVIGRVVGKFVGILLFAWLAIAFGIAKKPASLTFTEISGAGALAGMGLTVSLFIAELAYTDPVYVAQVRLGLLLSALISAAFGLTILLSFYRRSRQKNMAKETDQ